MFSNLVCLREEREREGGVYYKPSLLMSTCLEYVYVYISF